MWLALPDQHIAVSEKKFNQTLTQLLDILRIARTEALGRGTIVTLCPYTENIVCGDDWSRGIILFIDETARGEIATPTDVITNMPFSTLSLRIFFNAFPSGSSRYLQFSGNGFTRYQNGSFYYCPEDTALNAQRVVINQAGRAYVTNENAQAGCRRLIFYKFLGLTPSVCNASTTADTSVALPCIFSASAVSIKQAS